MIALGPPTIRFTSRILAQLQLSDRLSTAILTSRIFLYRRPALAFDSPIPLHSLSFLRLIRSSSSTFVLSAFLWNTSLGFWVLVLY